MFNIKIIRQYIVNAIILAGFVGCLFFVSLYMYANRGNEDTNNDQVQRDTNGFIGSGLVEDPYLIENENQLRFVADSINRGEDYCNYAYMLVNDIELTGDNKELQIGTEDGMVFRGIFDGNGHTISGFDQHRDKMGGMFAVVTGSVFNLSVEGSFSAENVGAVVCHADLVSNIINCMSKAQIDADNGAGIVWKLEGKAINCLSVGGVEPVYEKGEYCRITHCTYKEANDYIFETGDKIAAASLVKEMNGFIGKMDPLYKVTYWTEDNNNAIQLSNEVADTFSKGEIKATIDGKQKDIEGFFSVSHGAWCFCVPAFVEEKEFEAVLTRGSEKKKYILNADTNEVNECIDDMDFTIKLLKYDDAPTLFIDSQVANSIEYLYQNKSDKITGNSALYSAAGELLSETAFKALSCRGNSSYSRDIRNKNSLCLEFDDEISLLGLSANDDYVLISGYRDNSLLSYIFERTLFRKMDLPYAQDFRLVDLYIDGTYMGLYLLTGSQEIAEGRFDIKNAYEQLELCNSEKLSTYKMVDFDKDSENGYRAGYIIPNIPEDITGGYVLEVDTADWPAKRARFKSKHGTTVTMKSGDYSAIEQVNYVADFWEEYEDALYSDSGVNAKGKHYSEYLDVESMADMCAVYELTMDSATTASVYFYKDSDNTSDGKLHAACHWDSEHSFAQKDLTITPWLLNVPEKQELIEKQAGFFVELYKDKEFRSLIKKEWDDKFVDNLLQMIGDKPMEGEYKNIDSFVKEYSTSDVANDYRWYGCSMAEKEAIIKNAVRARMEIMSEWK